mgnify:CR=1 FL=1
MVDCSEVPFPVKSALARGDSCRRLEARDLRGVHEVEGTSSSWWARLSRTLSVQHHGDRSSDCWQYWRVGKNVCSQRHHAKVGRYMAADPFGLIRRRLEEIDQEIQELNLEEMELGVRYWTSPSERKTATRVQKELG